jgi:hypothetical protein
VRAATTKPDQRRAGKNPAVTPEKLAEGRETPKDAPLASQRDQPDAFGAA